METLSTHLQSFFDWLLRSTFQASIVVCLVLLIQGALRSRITARWHYALWLILIIRMVLPWTPQSRFSIFNFATWQSKSDVPRYAISELDAASPNVSGESSVAQQTILIQEQSIQKDGTTVAVTSDVPSRPLAADPATQPAFRLHGVLPFLWLTGALLLGGYIIICNLKLWQAAGIECPSTDKEILELLEECRSEIGLRTIVALVPSDKVNTPILLGFIRPRLLVPKSITKELTREELRYVLLHELAHVKRHDIALGWLTALLQVLHWFNPFVWLAFHRMRSNRELACDALVLSRTQGEGTQDYGRAIVSLLEHFSLPQSLPGLAGILESKSQLKRRIAMIARFKKDSYRWSPLAVILIIILACVSLPDAKRTKASGISAAKPGRRITLRQVWSGPGITYYGAPSPDGRYLSYVDWETGDLAIYEIATGKKRGLTNKGTWDESDEYAYSSRWSPDSTQIAYQWCDREGHYVELCVRGLEDSEHHILYSIKNRNEWIEPHDWSPDGKHILACLSEKDGNKIVLVSAADGSVRVLKTLYKFYPRNMCFSPDGRYIVYSYPPKEDSPERDISLLTSDGSREISLVKHPADDYVLGWGPDGKNILFASDRTGSLGAWLIAVAEGKPQGAPELVKADIGRFQPMGFTRDGSFYYGQSKRKRISDIYIAELDPETGEILAPPKRAITRFEGSNEGADYSPDGKYLSYVSIRRTMPFITAGPSHPYVLRIHSLETGEERELFPKLKAIRKPRWSPDCRSFLVKGMDYNNRRGIFQMDAQTGDVTPIVLSDEYEKVTFGLGEWSRDGKAIFYARRNDTNNLWQIIFRDLETGIEKVLYHAPEKETFHFRISPDGNWLALNIVNSNWLIMKDKSKRVLKIIPAAGGEPRELYRFEERILLESLLITWTADGKYILFARKGPSDQRWELCRISADGGQPEKLGLEMRRLFLMSVHPDGQHIAFKSTTGRPAEVWVMENFLPEAPVVKPEPTTTLRKIRDDWGLFASLSPDGKYLSGVDWNTGDLLIRELATGKERRLTSEGSWRDSAMSPDGNRIAYLWYDPNTETHSLYISKLDGSARRLLRRNEYIVPRDWSADGKKILAILFDKDAIQMVWVSASDGSIRRIKSVGKKYFVKYDVSPDGRFIAYDRPQAEGTAKRDIFLLDVSGNREIALLTHPDDDKLLGWTPDGEHVFFASDRTGTWDGWLLQVVGGKPQGVPKLVKQNIGDVIPIGFTQSGSYYYRSEQTLRDVFMATLDLETGKVLSEPMPVRQTGATTCHDWSPDGQYLAYCTQRPDRTQRIYIHTLATGQELMLADNIPYIRWLRWSLDGRSILIDGFEWGDSQGVIHRIDVQTGERTDLVRSTTEVLIRPELSPDGKTLFYDRADPNLKTCRLVARDLQNGREKELFRSMPPARLTGSALSPDGQRFVLSIVPAPTRPAAPVLKILSAAGGEPRELIQFDKSENLRAVGVAWMPESQDVLFWKWFQGGKELELWRISAEGGEPRKLWARKTLGHLRVHPDGQRIAFYSRSTTSETWVMENFLPAAVASAGK